MKQMDTSTTDDQMPPPGTAIVRPLRHVRAVRERYLLRFTDPSQAAASRSARAWAWALGETAIAPVTDQQTPTPPSRCAIEVEIAIADGRSQRDEDQNRADAAATILRWLIGDDDHVPVRTESPGELVGGFGHIVRSPVQIAGILSMAVQGAAQRTAVLDRDLRVRPVGQEIARQDAVYLEGVAATLEWVLGERPGAPISPTRPAGWLSGTSNESACAPMTLSSRPDTHGWLTVSRHAGTAKASSSPSPGSLVTPPPSPSIRKAADPTTQTVRPFHLDLGHGAAPGGRLAVDPSEARQGECHCT
jgi:hypothetical protein